MNEQLTLKEETRELLRTVKQKVFKLLTDHPEIRDSYKATVWQYWRLCDGIIEENTEADDEIITYNDFIRIATHPLTIIRTATQIRKEHPELGPSKEMTEKLNIMEEAYHEEFKPE